MIVKIDVDGVIRDINSKMCEIYNQTFNQRLTINDIFDYDVTKVFKKIKEKTKMSAVDFFFHLHSKDVFLHSKPYEGVKEAIDKLRTAGHKVIIVTWQFNLNNKINTLLFLEKNNIHYDDICFTRDKWMIQGDYLIDDNPEFIMEERDSSEKILIEMPYNKNIDCDVMSVSNLQQAADFILQNATVFNYKCPNSQTFEKTSNKSLYLY